MVSVNVRPYRYPHFQKHEIELQVEMMLQKGLTQPSTSPLFTGFVSKEIGWLLEILRGLSGFKCCDGQG